MKKKQEKGEDKMEKTTGSALNSNLELLICGILEVEASKWKKIFEVENSGIDLTNIVDSLQDYSQVDLISLLGELLKVKDEYIQNLVLEMVNKDITNGQTIFKEIRKNYMS